MRTVNYKQFLELEKKIKELQDQGVIFLFKRNKIKMTLGIGCLAIAMIPNGLGIIFYPLGFFLLGIGTADLFRFWEEIMRRIKIKLRISRWR